MAYKSPIELICDDIQYDVEQAYGQATIKVVQHYFPLVDEEELFKALRYDRNQYEAGFRDGWKARDAEIVRCKDCKHQEKTFHADKRMKNGGYYVYFCDLAEEYSHVCLDEDFCSKGERRDDG